MSLTFNNVFWITNCALRIIGAHPQLRHDKKWFAKFVFLNVISCISFYFLANSIIFHDIRNAKYAEAIKNGSIAIVAVTIVFKYFVLVNSQESVAKLIEIIDDDYSKIEQFTEEEKRIILLYSKKGVNVCKFWFTATFSTCTMFPIKALFSMASSYFQGEFRLVLMFDLTFPKFIEAYKDVIYVFAALCLLSFIFDIYACSMYIGFDPLVSIFLLHVCGQIDILSKRIKEIVTRTTDEREIMEELKKINQKLQVLHR